MSVGNFLNGSQGFISLNNNKRKEKKNIKDKIIAHKLKPAHP